MSLNISIKHIIFLLLLSYLSVNAVVPTPKPLQYSAIFNTSFFTYKACALENNGGCLGCELACGDQDILRFSIPFPTMCTRLREFCKEKLGVPSRDACTKTKCISRDKHLPKEQASGIETWVLCKQLLSFLSEAVQRMPI